MCYCRVLSCCKCPNRSNGDWSIQGSLQPRLLRIYGLQSTEAHTEKGVREKRQEESNRRCLISLEYYYSDLSAIPQEHLLASGPGLNILFTMALTSDDLSGGLLPGVLSSLVPGSYNHLASLYTPCTDGWGAALSLHSTDIDNIHLQS